MGNWNGFISRRKTRFFSRGETADFSFDRAPVSRLDTCNARVIYRVIRAITITNRLEVIYRSFASIYTNCFDNKIINRSRCTVFFFK